MTILTSKLPKPKVLDFTADRGNAVHMLPYLKKIYGDEKGLKIFNESKYTEIIAYLEFNLGSSYQIAVELEQSDLDEVNKKVEELINLERLSLCKQQINLFAINNELFNSF